ncbi:MAG: hypothetical protein DRI44_02580 [Chlamydiae bacterium]|nr:MAG: hypothetical protein DRI44_02580 [Chlamydiota bacterium]
MTEKEIKVHCLMTRWDLAINHDVQFPPECFGEDGYLINGICLKELGHDGEHEFVPLNEVRVTFKRNEND